ncbi:AcrR family transcriptional regulator [Catenibacillus scindens]|uniref:AcrR family transcriptional regulator n=1 Tax=Catenibacillus scindens TaxID=673271 RepID=A0A7W8M5H0_9FIRM|nr:TetR/AcrR family transcriptional regulator [Catenibacillus scindens]MBB5265223.1 AcrR family transcriptional regulator [Catenibacillus scindens]
MARNKYPELTVEKILDTAQRLFLEKGYDNTTIQDIVDHLDGLSKGAVYHHFKSKEEIMDAVGDRMFAANNPFEKVKNRKDLNGLQKLQEAIRLNQSDDDRTSMVIQSIPLTRNPRLLVEMIQSNLNVLTPYYEALLEEGNKDGSVHTEYVKEIAELMPLLTSLWLLPSVFPTDKEGMKHKFRFIGEMLEKMGVPLMDDSIYQLVEEFFEKMPDEMPSDQKKK